MTKAVRRYVFFVVCLSIGVASLMATRLVPAAEAWRRAELAGMAAANTHSSPAEAVTAARRTLNIAPYARVTAFSAPDTAGGVDAGIMDAEDWTSAAQPTGSWIMLEWNKPAVVQGIDLYDRAGADDAVLSGVLSFSDGSVILVGQLPTDGSPARIGFEPKCVKWVRFRVGETRGNNPGLADIAVRGAMNPWSRTPAAAPVN
ncbi:MAG TPA: hypothetical protein VMU19_01430 [Bryobacteraceae bacterium]|nr:hypothetical protein [Bryobacteraceae bacterium]